MAAPSLLGCGRAVTRKVLGLEARGLREAAPSAALCTRPVGSGTTSAPPPNVVAPQGSTKMLAIKAPVEFPKMLSSSSLLASADKGESISSTNLEEASKPSAEDMRMFMSRKTVVGFPQRVVGSSLKEENLTTPATEGGLRKELVEEETSSSSSSDSDSEEEDDVDASGVAIKTKVEFPRRDSIFSDIAVKASMLAKENFLQKSHKENGAKKKPHKTEHDVSPVKPVIFSKTSVSHETSKSKARDPKVKSTPKEANRQKLVLEPYVIENQDLTDIAQKSDYLEEKSIGTQVAALQLKASSVTREDKKQKLVSRGKEKKVKEVQELEPEVTVPKLEETSESTMLVMGTTAKEEAIQEAGVQAGEKSTIEETTKAAEPAPEEFDNSTYKNLQHHEYNIYTFVDSVAVLSKFRQPQPSSGRPSPRH